MREKRYAPHGNHWFWACPMALPKGTSPGIVTTFLPNAIAEILRSQRGQFVNLSGREGEAPAEPHAQMQGVLKVAAQPNNKLHSERLPFHRAKLRLHRI